MNSAIVAGMNKPLAKLFLGASDRAAQTPMSPRNQHQFMLRHLQGDVRSSSAFAVDKGVLTGLTCQSVLFLHCCLATVSTMAALIVAKKPTVW